MIEKWKKCLDKNGKFGALLIDLSLAFYCLYRNLLIGKLHAYGFDKNVLKLVYSYLHERKIC